MLLPSTASLRVEDRPDARLGSRGFLWLGPRPTGLGLERPRIALDYEVTVVAADHPTHVKREQSYRFAPETHHR